MLIYMIILIVIIIFFILTNQHYSFSKSLYKFGTIYWAMGKDIKLLENHRKLMWNLGSDKYLSRLSEGRILNVPFYDSCILENTYKDNFIDSKMYASLFAFLSLIM